MSRPRPIVDPPSRTLFELVSRTLRATAALFAVGAIASLPAVHIAAAQTVPEAFALEEIHSKPGTKSVGFSLLPDGRILLIGHQNGQVRLLVDGELKPEPVLTLPDLIFSSERGLLGIAVDPDYPDSNFVYLFYTSGTGVNRVSKFRVDGDLDVPMSHDLSIDPETERILMQLPDNLHYHNGGTIRFGSDKTLYISHGDDGRWKEDEEPYMQDLSNPYGKILRINRDGSAPADNPTFADEGTDRMPEVFAIGLRNPFRFAIDPHTDELFIGDVGTNVREEYNIARGGENFGYPRHEGTSFFQETYALIAPEPTPPVYDYTYGGSHKSAIALFTYRPKDRPNDSSFPAEFDGGHFYTDYFDDEIRYLQRNSEREWESKSFGTGFARLTDAALAPDGSVYVLEYDGALYRISYENPSTGVETPPVAQSLELQQNYPNPFTESTTITYRISRPADVLVEVYDVLGRRIETLVNRRQAPGIHAVRLKADGLAPGTYLYRLSAGGAVRSATMIRMPD